jgi:hypothetical protein
VGCRERQTSVRVLACWAHVGRTERAQLARKLRSARAPPGVRQRAVSDSMESTRKGRPRAWKRQVKERRAGPMPTRYISVGAGREGSLSDGNPCAAVTRTRCAQKGAPARKAQTCSRNTLES